MSKNRFEKLQKTLISSLLSNVKYRLICFILVGIKYSWSAQSNFSNILSRVSRAYCEYSKHISDSASRPEGESGGGVGISKGVLLYHHPFSKKSFNELESHPKQTTENTFKLLKFMTIKEMVLARLILRGGEVIEIKVYISRGSFVLTIITRDKGEWRAMSRLPGSTVHPRCECTASNPHLFPYPPPFPTRSDRPLKTSTCWRHTAWSRNPPIAAFAASWEGAACSRTRAGRARRACCPCTRSGIPPPIRIWPDARCWSAPGSRSSDLVWLPASAGSPG